MIFYSCNHDEEVAIQDSIPDVRIENIDTRNGDGCYDIDDYGCASTTFHGAESGVVPFGPGSKCMLNYTYDVETCTDANGNNLIIVSNVMIDFEDDDGCDYYRELIHSYFLNGDFQAIEDLMDDMLTAAQNHAQDNIFNTQFLFLLPSCSSGGTSTTVEFYASNCYKWQVIYDVHQNEVTVDLVKCNETSCCIAVSKWCRDISNNPVQVGSTENSAVGTCITRECYNACLDK